MLQIVVMQTKYEKNITAQIKYRTNKFNTPMLFHARRKIMAAGITSLLRLTAWLADKKERSQDWETIADGMESEPTTNSPYDSHLNTGAYAVLKPDDFKPLEPEFFQNPYIFYKLLRDSYPVYQLPNGIFCISRYADIVTICKDTERFSSTYQGLIPALQPNQHIEKVGKQYDIINKWGVTPGNNLALNDPPAHTLERQIATRALHTGVARQLDTYIPEIVNGILDRYVPTADETAEVEFINDMAERMPILSIMHFVGLPASDYDFVSQRCAKAIQLQSGVGSPSAVIRNRAACIDLYQYLWEHYLQRQKQAPLDDAIGLYIKATQPAAENIDERAAITSLFQLLVAGSTSTSTCMGAAIKMLIENPSLAEEIRRDIDTKLPAFLEEVFRLEAAFQGHFRWAKEAVTLHGIHMPQGSRVFIMWGSGNRDEYMFPEPDQIQLNRPNGGKHLTFGHSAHACIGREITRKAIFYSIKQMLLRTKHLRITGETPYVASMFTHTLLQLPIAFEARAEDDQDSPAVHTP